jgi:hypothetical protein
MVSLGFLSIYAQEARPPAVVKSPSEILAFEASDALFKDIYSKKSDKHVDTVITYSGFGPENLAYRGFGYRNKWELKGPKPEVTDNTSCYSTDPDICYIGVPTTITIKITPRFATFSDEIIGFDYYLERQCDPHSADGGICSTKFLDDGAVFLDARKKSFFSSVALYAKIRFSADTESLSVSFLEAHSEYQGFWNFNPKPSIIPFKNSDSIFKLPVNPALSSRSE